MDAQVSELLAHLQSSAFRDVAGARLSARIPIARALVSSVVARALQGSRAPVKSVDVRPHEGDQLEAIVTVTWPFVPPLTVGMVVERQPQFPASPQLVLRWSLLGGLGALASRFVKALDRLPPGMLLDGDRLVLDIPVLAAGSPAAAVLPYVKNLQIHTTEGGLVLEADLEVTPP